MMNHRGKSNTFFSGRHCRGGYRSGLSVRAICVSRKTECHIHFNGCMDFEDMACSGHPYVKTPNIDRLANEGTLVNDFYVNSGVCASIWIVYLTTGIFSVHTNAYHIYLPWKFAFRGNSDLLVQEPSKWSGENYNH